MRRFCLTGSLVVVAAALAAFCLLPRPRRTPPLPSPAPGAIRQPVPSPRIVIEKAQRRLTLHSGDRAVKAYRIALGRNPVGDKEREGDGRTPEGDYRVCVKNPQSRFTLSLGLSYPNAKDAARGLAARLISQEQHAQIVGAIERGERPPWDTPLGGEIFIHGSGAGSDWTRGCIALDDPDIRDLFPIIPVGTPVTIVP